MNILIYAKPTFEGASLYNSKHWATIAQKFYNVWSKHAQVFVCLNKFQVKEVSIKADDIILFDHDRIAPEDRFELDFIFNDRNKVSQAKQLFQSAVTTLNNQTRFDLIVCLADKGLVLRELFPEVPTYSFIESICTRKPFPSLFHFDPFGIDDTDVVNTLGVDKIIASETNELQISEIKELRKGYQSKFFQLGSKYLTEGLDRIALFPLQYEGVSALRLYSKFATQAEALLYVLGKFQDYNLYVTEHPQYPVLSSNFVYNTKLIFPNLYYKPENILIEGLSSCLIPYADMVIAQTSSVGAQAALIFGKTVHSISRTNRLTPYAELSTSQNAEAKSEKLLNWMFRRFDLPAEVIFDSNNAKQLIRILVDGYAQARRGEVDFSDFSPITYHHKAQEQKVDGLNIRNPDFIKYSYTCPAIYKKIETEEQQEKQTQQSLRKGKHILMYTPAMTRVRGGIEQLISNIAPSFVKEKFRLTVITHDRGQNLDSKPVYDLPSEVEVVNFTFGLKYENIKKLRSKIEEINPDAIIVMDGCNVFMQFALALNGKDIPIAFSEHFAPEFSAKQLPHNSQEARRSLVKFCDIFHILEDKYRESIRSEDLLKTQVIHNPIAKPKEFVKYIDKSEYRIVNVARIHFAQKNQLRLIQAFGSLMDDYPEWNLHLYGAAFDAKDAEILSATISQNKFTNRVFWHNQVNHEELMNQLADSDLFVLPSNYEGSPISMVEAMAMGLPSIGFEKCEGVNCLIKSGINGFLAPNLDDYKSLAFAMKLFMSSRETRERMGQEAKLMINKRSEQEVHQDWLRLANDLLSIERKAHKIEVDPYYRKLVID